jgi:hypothetical protein
MSVSDAGRHSLLQTESIIAGIVVKFSIKRVHQRLWRYLTLVLPKKYEFVMDVITSWRRKQRERKQSHLSAEQAIYTYHGSDRAVKQAINTPQSARALADAELQRAIELSLQEMKLDRRPGYTPAQPSPSKWSYSEPPIVDRIARPTNRKVVFADEEEDPDLKAAIEASLREANAPKPSAPVEVDTPHAEAPSFNLDAQTPVSVPLQPAFPKIPTYELEPLESDAILTFNQTVDQVQAQGGRDLSRYPAVTELYDKANGLRPKLAMSLDDAGRKESRCFSRWSASPLLITRWRSALWNARKIIASSQIIWPDSHSAGFSSALADNIARGTISPSLRSP